MAVLVVRRLICCPCRIDEAAAETTTYTYDARHRNTSVSSPGSGTTTLSWYRDDRLHTITRPGAVVSTTTYDRAARVEAIAHNANGTPLATLAYEHDLNGNRQSESLTHTGQPPIITTYIHDQADRLQSFTVSGTTTTYTLDGVGNRTRERTAAGAQPATIDRSCTFDSRDRIASCTDAATSSTETYAWDRTGRMTAETIGGLARTATWDARDRLLQRDEAGGASITYAYDAEGMRIETRQGAQGERVQYDAGHRHAETTGAGAVTRRYEAIAPHRATSRGGWARVGAAAMTLFLGMTDAGAIPAARHYLHDAQGTPIAITTQEGALAQRSAFDPWGNPTQQEVIDTGLNINPNRIGFTGYVLDVAGSRTGNGSAASPNSPIANAGYYAKARYYGGGRGSFLSVDPWSGDETNPLSYNKYLYGYANPGVFVDPDGRCPNPMVMTPSECFNFQAENLGVDPYTREGVEAVVQFEGGRASGQLRGSWAAVKETAQFFADIPGSAIDLIPGVDVGSLDRMGDRAVGLWSFAKEPVDTVATAIEAEVSAYAEALEAGDYRGAGEVQGNFEGGAGAGAAMSYTGAGLATLVRGSKLARVVDQQGKAVTVAENPSGPVAPSTGPAPLSSSPVSGPVRLRPPPNATPDEIAQARAYCDGCNDALARGELSPTGRVSTTGLLSREASRAAAKERARASAAGQPYQGHAGHVPDTTWTGNANPPAWADLSPRVNTSLGGQSGHYPVGYKPTTFQLIEDLEKLE